jgi:sugar lactone lactonase YvrE
VRARSVFGVTAVLLLGAALAWWQWPADPIPPLQRDWRAVVSVIGGNAFVEPHGVAVAPGGAIYVADGVGGNRVHRIEVDGTIVPFAGRERGFADGTAAAARFDTPSAVVVDRDGTVFVADTGNNAIRRLTSDGQVSTLTTALNGPMGLAIDSGGRLLVADTYNDRIVSVDRDGTITPLMLTAALDTPTALAADSAGTLYIADTGNNVVHVVTTAGTVTTIDAAVIGGWRHPLGVAIDSAGTLYVTDDTSRVTEVLPGAPLSARVVAGSSPGFRNGFGDEAQFRRPAGLIAIAPGRLVVADAGNGLLRTVTATALAEAAAPPSPTVTPRFDVEAFRGRPLLWPLEPLHGPFEIAGTLGEARGDDADRFHAGIDVRGEQGAPVLAVRDGVVAGALSTGDFGSLNEWLRVGALTYVHLRVGRTHDGQVVDAGRFGASRDERKRITRIRVKRGTHFSTGDVIGTVNPFNHVHLNVGWGGEEYNPLLFRLVQFEDTVPPSIARGGIRLYDLQGAPLVKDKRGRVIISGPVQIVVDAWDQANGNRPGRRLGVYSLGYQVLQADGAPAPGFAAPVETIRFDRLATDPNASRLVYAPGSGIPFYGRRRTRFLYIVTNTFRDGVAGPGLWNATTLPPGDYTLRVRVTDIAGNEALRHRDLAVTIAARAHTAGE